MYPQNQIAYLEIRGATGGDEAKLWGNDLLRMYERYAGKKGWKVIRIWEHTVQQRLTVTRLRKALTQHDQ